MSNLVLVKRILYCAPSRDHFLDFAGLAARVRGCVAEGGAEELTLTCHNVQARFCLRGTPAATAARLREEYFNLLVLDARALPREGFGPEAAAAPAFALLDLLEGEEDVEARYPLNRILVLVQGSDDATDRLMVRFAGRGVARVVRDPGPTGATLPGVEPSAPRLAFASVALEEMARLTTERRPGKVALCLAGGGTTGIFFEQGALKCLADCLPPGALNALDLYFGISAGAVVSGVLANGYGIDEFLAAIAGEGRGSMRRLDLNVVRFAHLNLGALVEEVRVAARHVLELVGRALPGTRRAALEALLLDVGDLVPPPFHGRVFEGLLREAFTAPGHTNDFRRLPRPLFIGATDQDSRWPVLFGGPEGQDVPISLAIQASMSLNPAFTSTKIGGRYYEDGGVTRTTNFIEAIRRGADLLFIIDPLVPYVSKTPGYARARGALYNIDQNIRTISYTRYANTRRHILREHPEVSFYTFLPQNTLRRRLAYNPLDHRPFLHIWRGAYLSTLQRMQQLGHRLTGDLAAHGIRLDPRPAEQVAAQLQATDNPRFADFFPGREITLARPSPPPPRGPEAAPTRDLPVVRSA